MSGAAVASVPGRPGVLTPIRLAWMLSRPSPQSRAVLVLPAVAFAVVTALLIVLLGGVQAFWRWTDQDAISYQVLSVIALALLVVPLVNLGGAAARLSARRRDERLSTLRLLGASPRTVAVMTVIEATAIAVAGALAGVLVAVAISPLVGLIPFRGSPIGGGSLLLGIPQTICVVLAMAVLAAASAAVGLRGVVISPLGVRTRQRTPAPHWVRALIAIGVVVVTVLAMSALQVAGSIIAIAVVLGVGFGASLAILGLAGPWALGVAARRHARRAATPARLLAARSILDAPKAAWRQVSGVAMTSFMAVFAGTGLALVDLAGAGTGDHTARLLFTDIRTGVIITVAASFVMVACSVVVNQLSQVLDQRALYVSLDRLGMPPKTMDAARVQAVMYPLCFVSFGSAVVAAVVVFPLTGAALIFAPLSVLVIALILLGGVALVFLGLRLTRGALISVLTHPERG